MPPTPDDGSGPLDVDAAFAEIVARWGDEARTDEADTDGARTDDGSTDGTRSDGTATDDASADDARGEHPRGDGAQDGAGTTTGEQAPGDPDGAGPGRHAMPPPPGRTDPEGSRTVRPARPLPPAPREDVPQVPPASSWGEHVPSPTTREGAADDRDPAELAFLDERFVPEEPRPLPRDLIGWAAWAAVVGAPLFLLVVALAWRDVPQLITDATAAVFVAGFATLVVRLPGSRDDDDDDGAVV